MLVVRLEQAPRMEQVLELECILEAEKEAQSELPKIEVGIGT